MQALSHLFRFIFTDVLTPCVASIVVQDRARAGRSSSALHEKLTGTLDKHLESLVRGSADWLEHFTSHVTSDWPPSVHHPFS